MIKNILKGLMCLCGAKESLNSVERTFRRVHKFMETILLVSENVMKVKQKTWDRLNNLYLDKIDITNLSQGTVEILNFYTWLKSASNL